jgi:hypothetical protein
MFLLLFTSTVNAPSHLQVHCQSSTATDLTVASSFGCHVINSIKKIILGTAFIILGSFSVAEHTSVAALFVGMVIIVVTRILSFIYVVDTPFFTTKKSYDDDGVYYLALIMGCVVLSLQLTILLRIFIPKQTVPKFHEMTKSSTNGMVRKEAMAKKAAISKIRRLVDNAKDLHEEELLLLLHDMILLLSSHS